VNVLSAEPSPSTFPYLKRSWETSPWKSRWHIDSRAISATSGTVTFSVAKPGMGAFDGMQDTLRAGPMRTVDVPASTLDDLWKERGMPRVSAIKIDIEGAETLALRGGEELIAAQRPFLILEWNRMNLAAYEFPVGSLATWAQAHNYIVRSLPTFQTVGSPQDLAFHSLLSESYLLSPAERMPHCI
jgi:FkbM family methyltransferase